MVGHVVRALPLALALLTAGCGGGTEPKTTSLDGDYVLLTVDGASPPVVVQSGLVGEILQGARLEISGTAVRDIKQRRKTNSSTVVTDTLNLTMSRVSDRMILTRPNDQPTVVPDTATIQDGVVPYALLTLRTRTAPSSASAQRMSLVYTIQK